MGKGRDLGGKKRDRRGGMDIREGHKGDEAGIREGRQRKRNGKERRSEKGRDRGSERKESEGRKMGGPKGKREGKLEEVGMGRAAKGKRGGEGRKGFANNNPQNPHSETQGFAFGYSGLNAIAARADARFDALTTIDVF
jgi:hypothetical protein